MITSSGCQVLATVKSYVSEYITSPKNMELEIKIGEISDIDDKLFHLGYRHPRVLDIVGSLIQRLGNMAQLKNNWESVPQYHMIRVWHAENIRQTCRVTNNDTKTTEEVHHIKSQYRNTYIRTSRPQDLQIVMSSITELPKAFRRKPIKVRAVLEQQKPHCMEIVQRASFIETIGYGKPREMQFKLKYDISKVSAPGKNKFECTMGEATYQCELELYQTPDFPRDMSGNMKQDVITYISRVFLSRAKSLLGTTIRKHTETYEKLPQCQVSISN
jgi:hypothetical protein